MKHNGRTLLKASQEPVTALAPFALPLDPVIYDEPEQTTTQPLLFSELDEEAEEENDDF